MALANAQKDAKGLGRVGRLQTRRLLAERWKVRLVSRKNLRWAMGFEPTTLGATKAERLFT
jgi:hypothetical protein